MIVLNNKKSMCECDSVFNIFERISINFFLKVTKKNTIKL